MRSGEEALGARVRERTIRELQTDMRAGLQSSEMIVTAYLQRVATLENAGPSLGSVIEINPAALEDARNLDAERAGGTVRGPLHGVPVLLKDNIDTADRQHTSAGSLALSRSIPARDSGVAARLREAGAVLLGKANLSEWANFRSSRSISGWSGRGGQCRNPYALDRSPCGSSSGSAVAAAASLAAVTIGTETDGSIVCPSAACGVVGFKPTVGAVSRSGIVPISHSQDTAGPMGRSVEDVVLTQAAIQGPDPRDELTLRTPEGAMIQAHAVLDAGALAGKRLGIVTGIYQWHPLIERQMEGVRAALRALGAELVEPVLFENAAEWREAEREVLLFEFKHGIDAYLASLPDLPGSGQPRDLAGLIAFNREHAATSMPRFGQEIFEQAVSKGGLDDPAYLHALAASRRLTREEGIDALLGEHRLDALVCPTAGPAFIIDNVNGDCHKGSASSPAAVAGYPHVTVPAGFVHGLPWGLSFFAGAWDDAKVLSFAYAFEHHTAARRPPRYLPSVVLDG